jgi:predicted AAA+ superfamily ATPase
MGQRRRRASAGAMGAEAMREAKDLQCGHLHGSRPAMTEDLLAALTRIAAALERLAPPPEPEPDLTGRLYRYDAERGHFAPAPDYRLPLDLLLGIERQKTRMTEALHRFAASAPANHVLLWGVRGTGKSSLVKAAVMAEPSLKLVEVDRDHIAALPALFERLRCRGERVVVFCDDLSFEAGAAAAKSLKSALEGGVAGPPENVLFIATSNRRHLAPQSHDEAKGLLATAEEAEETVSVSDRFGLWIGFPPMDQTAYLGAVNAYAQRFDLQTADLDLRALQWSQLRGARSGRVAFQFIRELAGELGKGLPV